MIWAKMEPPELAVKSGVDRESVYKHLRGEVENPRGDVRERYADAVGVTSVWLKEASGAPRPGLPDESAATIEIHKELFSEVAEEIVKAITLNKAWDQIKPANFGALLLGAYEFRVENPDDDFDPPKFIKHSKYFKLR